MADSNLLAGPALRRLRKRDGLTQAAMAAMLGISPSYLNLIERNWSHVKWFARQNCDAGLCASPRRTGA